MVIEEDEQGRFAIGMLELAERLSVSKRTLENAALDGRLPTIWVGNKQLVGVDTVRRILSGELRLAPPRR